MSQIKLYVFFHQFIFPTRSEGKSTGCLLRHLAVKKRPSINRELQTVHTNTVENDIRETNENALKEVKFEKAEDS